MNLSEIIQKILPMPAEKAELIADSWKDVDFKAGDLILKEGKVSRQTYFLKEGFIRSFTHDTEGNEVTTRIYAAPDFANDFLSYFKGVSVKEHYQALTDCSCRSLDFDRMQYLFHNIPEFREFGRMMLTLNYEKVHSRMLSMIQQTAETRYLNLLEHRPEVIQHLPLKIIASYLGITDSSLSRIRREIAKK